MGDSQISNPTVTSLNLVEVTLAENWFKSTDSPLFIFAKPLDNEGIEEKIEFAILV